MLLIGHVPHRLKPEPQRLARPLESRSRDRRCLAIASTTSKLAPGSRPRRRRSTGRTPETIRPTDTQKIIRTGRLRRKPRIEFTQRAWIVDPADGRRRFLGHPNILSQRERSGYPIFVIVRPSRGRSTSGSSSTSNRDPHKGAGNVFFHALQSIAWWFPTKVLAQI